MVKPLFIFLPDADSFSHHLSHSSPIARDSCRGARFRTKAWRFSRLSFPRFPLLPVSRGRQTLRPGRRQQRGDPAGCRDDGDAMPKVARAPATGKGFCRRTSARRSCGRSGRGSRASCTLPTPPFAPPPGSLGGRAGGAWAWTGRQNGPAAPPGGACALRPRAPHPPPRRTPGSCGGAKPHRAERARSRGEPGAVAELKQISPCLPGRPLQPPHFSCCPRGAGWGAGTAPRGPSRDCACPAPASTLPPRPFYRSPRRCERLDGAVINAGKSFANLLKHPKLRAATCFLRGCWRGGISPWDFPESGRVFHKGPYLTNKATNCPQRREDVNRQDEAGATAGKKAAVPGKGGAPEGGPPGAALATLTRLGGDSDTTFLVCPGKWQEEPSRCPARRAPSAGRFPRRTPVAAGAVLQWQRHRGCPRPGEASCPGEPSGHASCSQPCRTGRPPPLKGSGRASPPPGHAAPSRSPHPALPGAGRLGCLLLGARRRRRAAGAPAARPLAASPDAPRPGPAGCRSCPRTRSPLPRGRRRTRRSSGAGWQPLGPRDGGGQAAPSAEQRARSRRGGGEGPGGRPPLAAPQRLGRRRGQRRGPRQRHGAPRPPPQPLLPADRGVVRRLRCHVPLRGDFRHRHHGQHGSDVHRLPQLLHAEHLQLPAGQPGLLGLPHRLLLPAAGHLSGAHQEVAPRRLLLQNRPVHRGNGVGRDARVRAPPRSSRAARPRAPVREDAGARAPLRAAASPPPALATCRSGAARVHCCRPGDVWVRRGLGIPDTPGAERGPGPAPRYEGGCGPIGSSSMGISVACG